MKKQLSQPNRIGHRAKAGFTLTEILIASFVSTLAIGSMISVLLFGLKNYYLETDYLKISGANRRLIDNMRGLGDVVNACAVFYKANGASSRNPWQDMVQGVAGERGDVLVLYSFNKDTLNPLDPPAQWMKLSACHVFYLQPERAGSLNVVLKYYTATLRAGRVGTGAILTAINRAHPDYEYSGIRTLIGPVYTIGRNGQVFPRTAAAGGVPPTNGVFRLDPQRAATTRPAAIVTLPTRIPGRPGYSLEASTALTFTISPRN